jgi:hypothetical protein
MAEGAGGFGVATKMVTTTITASFSFGSIQAWRYYDFYRYLGGFQENFESSSNFLQIHCFFSANFVSPTSNKSF